jgi:hypothetical protein
MALEPIRRDVDERCSGCRICNDLARSARSPSTSGGARGNPALARGLRRASRPARRRDPGRVQRRQILRQIEGILMFSDGRPPGARSARRRGTRGVRHDRGCQDGFPEPVVLAFTCNRLLLAYGATDLAGTAP